MTLLSRRELFAQLTAITPAATPAPLRAPDPLVHFMNRTSFGIRQAEYLAAKGMGLDAWVNLQLNPAPLDVSALETAISTNFTTISLSGPALYNTYGPQTQLQFQPLSELRAATLLRQVYSPRQLFEVMVEFWTNHFSVEHAGQFVRMAKTLDDRDIREHALGNFRDLLRANAHGPAMLYYLDNYVNVKGNPNENYGRELLELHTLGVDGGYTEADVVEVARAFTGWSVNTRRAEFVFVANNHDTEAKTVLGKRLAANRGMQDGEDVLDLLASHPSTARFIASKLIRRFVVDTPSEDLVMKVSTTFIKSGGDIKAMLRTIFGSVDFAASADLKVKRPAEFVVSALRVSESTLTGTTYYRVLTDRLEGLGQQFSNWPTPDGYPDIQGYWINTSAWLNRWNYAFALSDGTLDRGLLINEATLAAGAQTPEQIVDRLTERLLRRELTSADRAAMVTLAAANGSATATLTGTTLSTRIREVIAVLLSSRYFNYR